MPGFVLLDEPTSGLDAGSEAMVIEALRRAGEGRTVIVVSHRLRITHQADRILVLEHGRVVEMGTRDALLAAGGTFSRFTALQEFPAGNLWREPALLVAAPGRDVGRV